MKMRSPSAGTNRIYREVIDAPTHVLGRHPGRRLPVESGGATVRLSGKRASSLRSGSLTPGQQKRFVDLALIEQEVIHGSLEVTVRHRADKKSVRRK
jgi:hypothetical protein